MRLLIARHGATQNNLEARWTGQLDVPLAPLGERQAHLLAEALATAHFDAVVSSDLRRALDTSESIARLHGLEVQRDPDLREISVGSWSGRSGASIRAEDPAMAARWEADPIHVAPPGGETVAELQLRAIRAYDRWYATYPTGDVLWVTHGGFLAALLCHVLGVDLARRWQFRRDNASITELEVGERGALLVRLNDISHLRGLAAEVEGERAQVL
jgi:broad specificity phosphatase PhoE